MPVSRKREAGTIDGTPSKRLFWSIISDYDLQTALCELIDNAIDLWTQGERKRHLDIGIDLDPEGQLVSVHDNAGGIRAEELRLLVAPGGSRNDPNAVLIGIFGVGGKRASVALGEHVEIRTRYQNGATHEVDITKDWLATDDWDLAEYQVPDISPGSTTVDISRLRRPIHHSDIPTIRENLGETYSWFLHQGCTITLNERAITAHDFTTWAYPPGFAPCQTTLAINLGSEGCLTATITAGLITDRDPEADNYGVYIYCNHRLITKALKTREVGYFVTTEAGVPHPDASLCRAIVDIMGPAKLMPWNSSKTGINPAHQAFQHVRPTLIRLVSQFSSLSRRLKDTWEQTVFPHVTGTIEPVQPTDTSTGRGMMLPPLPRVNKPKGEQLKTRNKAHLRNQPWTVGLVEAIAAVDIITRQHLDTKNRIALILLDSNFEIALKEFIVHRTDLFPPREYTDAKILQLFQRRTAVIETVTQRVNISPTLIGQAQHYYNLRNKLIHERATTNPTDTDIANYQRTVQELLTFLFKLSFPRR